MKPNPAQPSRAASKTVRHAVKTVFLLAHVHQLPRSEEEDLKIIGIYSTEAAAKLAIRRAKSRTGFRDHPNGFVIGRHELDRDDWREGFETVFYKEKKHQGQ